MGYPPVLRAGRRRLRARGRAALAGAGRLPSIDPAIFFPENGESPRQAKAICATCPVREPCLEDALAHRERYGVWGGLSEAGRRRVLRRRNGPTYQRGRRKAMELPMVMEPPSDRSAALRSLVGQAS